MKNKIKLAVILAVLAVALLCAGGGYAFADDAEQELNENISSLLDGLDLSALEEYLNNYGGDFIFSFGDSAREIIEYLIKGNAGIDYSGYIGEILSVLFSNVLSLVPAFAQIVALSILCAIVRSAEGGIMSRSTAKAVRTACCAHYNHTCSHARGDSCLDRGEHR